MRIPLLQWLAGSLGLTGVALGAAGAHALKPRLIASGHLETWQTAAQYHLVHAVAVLAVALYARQTIARPPGAGDRLLWRASVCWSVGVLLFSGSIYALSLGGPRWLGPVTPLGGFALLCGWVLVLLSGRHRPEPGSGRP